MFGVRKDRLRHLLQRWGWAQGGVELVRDVLQLSENAAAKLLDSLLDEGYIQRCAECHASPGWEYELTPKGIEFGRASTGKPLPRGVVQKLLHALVERMQKVNLEDRFFVGIQEATVFGEYLTDSGRLGNLDVQYTTYRKIQERAAFTRLVERAALESGRTFSGPIERRLWPEDEVKSFLQDRSPVYRFWTNSERLSDDRTPRLVVFRNRAPVPDWQKL
jgi:hypothetical protein